MNTIYSLYVRLGILSFWLLLPVERFFIKRTHRVYCLIVQGNKVLLTKNWLSDGKWAFPGGGVGRHESSEEALVRELHEEISVTGKELKYLASGNWQNHNFGFSYDTYVLKDEPSFKINRRLEITDAAWINISSLNETNTSEDVLSNLKKYKAKN